jgi:NAD(P)-dependent dehydrogenase (short-subunit alcohol dehydrogenase family)
MQDKPVALVTGANKGIGLQIASTGIKVNAACPGFTATDLNNFQGTRTVQQAALEPVRLALLDANGPTGTFSNEDGPLPW